MIGVTLGNYRIVGQIGEGGMGVVYLAEHTLLGRKVALKILRTEFCHNADVVGRFFNEARAAAGIRHPGLVDVFDFGHAPDGRAFIVMEFLEGESLAACMHREGRFAPAMAGTIGRQIAAAVGAAHQAGIVHRDLKPDNIFLLPERELAGGVRVKILDFGIAKLTADKAHSGTLKTRTGLVMGTPAYMAPEQCRGTGAVDSRADIYSLGCILFEMVCGRPPFLKEGAGELLAAHIYEPPLSPRMVEPSLPAALDTLLLRALAKDASVRPQSMEELRSELDRAVSTDARELPMRTVRTTAEQILARDATPPRTSDSTLGLAAMVRPTMLTPKRVGVVAGVGALLVVMALAAVFMRERSEVPATGTPSAPAAVVPQPEPAAPVQPKRPAPVKLTVLSHPTGADVFRAADGLRLGQTPYVLEIPPTDGTAVFLLKREGFADARAEMAADRNGEATVKLAPLPRKRKTTKAKAPVEIKGRKRIRDGALDPFQTE